MAARPDSDTHFFTCITGRSSLGYFAQRRQAYVVNSQAFSWRRRTLPQKTEAWV